MSFFDKITSYDLITSLIPGAFLVEAFRASGIPFVEASHLATWLLLAYALGILCNRIGSLVLEPRLRKRAHTYADYVTASKTDDRLEALVEKATFYRTMLTAGLVYLLGLGLFHISGDWISQARYAIPLSAIGAMALFYLSYVKQEDYISKRVERCKI